jgi:hypothetical protein
MRLLVSAMAALVTSANVVGADMHWPFDAWPIPGLRGHQGEAKLADGVFNKSLVVDGQTTVEVTGFQVPDSDSFTAAIWLNAYAIDRGQQMIMAKNRYSLDEREWGAMIDRDGRIKLYVWQGAWAVVDSGHVPKVGHWQHLLVSITPTSAAIRINGSPSKSVALKRPVAKTKAPLTFGGVNDNGRIWQNLFGALDDVRMYDRALSDAEATALYQPVASVHQIPLPPPQSNLDRKIYRLWSGPEIPADSATIPFAEGMAHRTIHDAREAEHKFLHGAAIINYKGTFFANWANSPRNENYPNETLRGRRTKDPLGAWSDLEIVGPGFEGLERHSHGVYLAHKGELWTFPARFGVGVTGRRFSGLGADALVLNETTGKWKNRGRAMDNCWPYDEPVRMENGSYITGGQDRNGHPVVAFSDGDNILHWTSVLIPFPPRLKPSFAETSVWAEGARVTALIRGGANVAWVATSDDYGMTWATAMPSNMPMPRAKCYFGKLSTGQLYLLSNLKNRDTLCVSVGQPGETTLSKIWRIRQGSSAPVPRFKGAAKSPQWSYPYGYEHDGKLYVVYSIGKEDCGLSVIPISALAAKN